FEITVALLIFHLHLLWAGLLFHRLIPWTAAGTTGTTSVGSCQQRRSKQQTTAQDHEPWFPRHETFSSKLRPHPVRLHCDRCRRDTCKGKPAGKHSPMVSGR